VHGRNFKFRDARTCALPTASLQLDHADLGPVSERRWDGLHFLK
jgi:hypothetical protein